MTNQKIPLFQLILNLLTKENERENVLIKHQGKIEIGHNELFKSLALLLVESGIPGNYQNKFVIELINSIDEYLLPGKNRFWLAKIKCYLLLFQELKAEQKLLDLFNSSKGNEKKRFMLFQLLTNMGEHVSLEPEEWQNLKV